MKNDVVARLKQWLDEGRKYRLAVMSAVAALCVCAVTLGLHAGSVEAAGTPRDLPIYNVKRDDKVVSISFDAAWGDEQTASLLATLEKYHVHTTFFTVGQWVERYPDQVRAIAAAGHEVMNHSDTHPHMTKLSRTEMTAELDRCSDRIEALTGVRPILFRAPYGDYDNTLVGAARACGMYTIQWDLDSLDWKDLTAAQICERILPKVQPGSIILLHNGGLHTPEALPMLLEGLQEQGYQVVPISELIYRENYSVDPNGTQIPRVDVNRDSASDLFS